MKLLVQVSGANGYLESVPKPFGKTHIKPRIGFNCESSVIGSFASIKIGVTGYLRMQKITAAILAVILAGSSIAEEPPLNRYQGCWKTDLPDDDITNTIVFCVDGQSIEALVFYPNDAFNPPTKCRSSGRIESIDLTTLAVRLGQGTCENDRSLAATAFTCTLLNENELNCLGPDSEQLHLVREISDIKRNERPLYTR